MLASLFLLVFLLGFPALILWSEQRSRVVKWISPIIICYLTGIIIGNIPGLQLNQEIQDATTGISVFLAIPLLLFSANLPVLLRQVRPALFSFFLGIGSVLVASSLAFVIFGGRMDDPASAAGMMVGVYTGGTQNMSAIGIALEVKEEVFVLLNSADIIFSGIYFLFLLSAGKRILGLFLPIKVNGQMHGEESSAVNCLEGKEGRPVHVVAGLALASILVGAAFGISLLLKGTVFMPIVILVVTTLGIAASFVRRIRTLPLTYATANYLLLVFAVAMGSMANFRELISASSVLFLFCGFVVFGSVFLHYLLAAVFRVDRDTLIISSTAAIFGPLFIGPVANAIGNRNMITIGIALGLIGYAIGNYLGLGLAFVLK